MNLPLFLNLLNQYGVSGNEEPVRTWFKQYVKEHNWPIVTDKMGSVFALKKSAKKDALNVVVGAHFDEVGFMVCKINNDGSVHLLPIGGIKPALMPGLEVVISTDKNTLVPAVVGLSSYHLGESSATTKISNYKVDLGCKNKDDVLNLGIRLGSYAMFLANAKLSANEDYLISKAIDNRLGLGVVCELIAALKDEKLPFNLYLGAHPQEEVGLRGARVMASTIKSDLFIALDCSPVNDLNDASASKLGNGFMVRYFDRGTILKDSLRSFWEEKITQSNHAHQAYYAQGGTDAIAYYTTKEGVMACSLLIPGRYLHSNAGVACLSDIKGLIAFLTVFLKTLTHEELVTLKAQYQGDNE